MNILLFVNATIGFSKKPFSSCNLNYIKTQTCLCEKTNEEEIFKF